MDSEILRAIVQHRKDRTRQFKNRFLRSIRPVCEELPSRKPDAVGTCALLQLRGHRFILSAAHVFDFFRTEAGRPTPLYIENQGRFLDITAGQLYRTGRPGDNHDDDPIDAGVLALPDNACPELSLSDFLTLEDVDLEATTAPLYIGVGFPLINARYTAEQKHLNMEGITCSGPSVPEKVESLGFGQSTHIVVEYDRYDMWVGADWSEAPEPTGMSGGPLFRFESLLYRGETSIPRDKLAGILIEKRDSQKVIIATRISIFLDVTRTVYPSLFVDSVDLQER